MNDLARIRHLKITLYNHVLCFWQVCQPAIRMYDWCHSSGVLNSAYVKKSKF